MSKTLTRLRLLVILKTLKIGKAGKPIQVQRQKEQAITKCPPIPPYFYLCLLYFIKFKHRNLKFLTQIMQYYLFNGPEPHKQSNIHPTHHDYDMKQRLMMPNILCAMILHHSTLCLSRFYK